MTNVIEGQAGLVILSENIQWLTLSASCDLKW